MPGIPGIVRPWRFMTARTQICGPTAIASTRSANAKKCMKATLSACATITLPARSIGGAAAASFDRLPYYEVAVSVSNTAFSVGDIVRHLRFDYRGVVVDVDAVFSGTEEWYQKMARSRPPKDRPWYHVLVDGADHSTYVAERHLTLDDTGEQVEHPQLGAFFDSFIDGRYGRRRGQH